MHVMWKVMEEHGSTLEKLAFAIAEESGLRNREVCNLRLTDVDQTSQRFFVRLPTKNKSTRRPYYHQKVRRYLLLWLEERDSNCGHDHLLHTRASSPIGSSGYLQTRIKDTLAKGGIGEYSFHRLRHTWATRLANAGMDPATLMELGGWKCWESMHQYVEMSKESIEDRYHAAMEKAKEDRELAEESVALLSELAFSERP